MHLVDLGHSFIDCDADTILLKVHQIGGSAQRIRIGLTGLAFAFLLVLLGSIVSRSSRDDVSNAAQQAAMNEPSEPLAELGVAPGASEATNNSTTRRK